MKSNLVAALCEMCGGSLTFVPEENAFACDYCGVKYPKEWLKNHMQVSGVVETTIGEAERERLIKSGNSLLRLQQYGDSENVFKEVTLKFPEDYRGWLGLYDLNYKKFSLFSANTTSRPYHSFKNFPLLSDISIPSLTCPKTPYKEIDRFRYLKSVVLTAPQEIKETILTNEQDSLLSLYTNDLQLLEREKTSLSQSVGILESVRRASKKNWHILLLVLFVLILLVPILSSLPIPPGFVFINVIIVAIAVVIARDSFKKGSKFRTSCDSKIADLACYLQWNAADISATQKAIVLLEKERGIENFLFL